MNILVDRLPTTLKVNGQEYRIDSDFRTCLRIMLAFQDAELAGFEKSVIFFENLFIDKPEDVKAALENGSWFLNGGKAEKDEDEGPRVFGWNKDANLIFAAFQQTHGIDLNAIEYMHWWKFLALFMDLGSETAFCNLVGMRKRVKTGKASKEERQMAREMGDAFIVEEIDDRTVEEREAERAFLAMVRGRKADNGSV